METHSLYKNLRETESDDSDNSYIDEEMSLEKIILLNNGSLFMPNFIELAMIILGFLLIFGNVMKMENWGCPSMNNIF